jgi:hypothetical protein
MAKLGQGQLVEGTSWTTATAEQHLDFAFGRDPQYLDKIVRDIVEANMPHSFSAWYKKEFPVKYVETNQPYRWTLRGFEDKIAVLQGAYKDKERTQTLSPGLGGTATSAGQAGSNFYMVFNKKLFTTTAIIVGENPDHYQLLVKDDGTQAGNGWMYRVELIANDSDHFIPTLEIDKGTRWSKQGGAVARYGTTRGQGITLTSNMEMQEWATPFRLERKFHGEMLNLDKNKPLWFGLKTNDGKTAPYWIDYEYYEMMKQFEEIRAQNFWYAQTSVDDEGVIHTKGENDQNVIIGRGVREQIMPSNKHYYDRISVKLLTDSAFECLAQKGMYDGAEFVVGTGWYGLRALHDALVRDLSANDYTWLGDETGRAFNWTGNDLTVKYGNFVGFATIGGIKFRFMHLPHYDDINRNKKRHPDGGYAESHRFTIMNFGSKSEPNIYRIRIKNEDPKNIIIPGLRSPYNMGGAKKGGNKLPSNVAATSFDGWEQHMWDREGAAVIDPTRIVEFVPSILRR